MEFASWPWKRWAINNESTILRSGAVPVPNQFAMESTQLYAIAAGGILSIIILYHFCNYLVQLASEHALVFCLKHLFYPFMLARHRFVGPWTRSSAVKQCLFWALTAFCTVFRTSTLADAGTRAGMLSMINMIPLYSGLHLSFVADLLGVSVRAYTRIHGSLGVMTGALALFHAVVAVTGGRSTSQDTNIYTLMVRRCHPRYTQADQDKGGISLAALLLFSVRFFRRPSYEIFLRFHQALAGLLMFAVWHHTPRGGLPARIYKYTMAGSLVATSVVQGCQILLRNLSLGQAGSRASLTKVQGCVFIDINVPRPWKVRAGQYINIWMPFFSLRSIFQTHPFMIVYWTDGPCPSLHLLIEPKDGLTRKLYERAYEIRSFDLAQDYQPHDLPQQAFHLAWITGPHGRGAPVGEYGTVLMIATGFGIAAQLPYLKELIRGFNHCEVRTRRIHLVWQLDRIGENGYDIHYTVLTTARG